MKKILAIILALVMLLAMGAMSVSATEEAAEVDLDGVYHATLGIQTNPTLWQNRMGYYVGNHDTTFGTEYWNKLCTSGTGENGETVYTVYAGEFNEVEIAGNGTYTVSLVNADFGGETSVSQLHAATDIPNTGAITFTDVIVKVNGRTVGEYEEGYLDKDGYADGLCVVLAYNNWRNELKSMGIVDPNLLPSGTENEISITFTVSGFNYDKVEEVVEETPVETEPEETAGGCAGSAAMLPFAAVIIAAALVVFKKRV